MNAVVTHKAPQSASVLVRVATKYGVDPDKMLSTLKATAFKGDVSNEQMMALLVVAEQHGLNPWTKEIYAFPDRGGIVPVVGVDGWARIINTHPSFDGMEFKEADDGAWIECTIHRKDRDHPISAKEWLVECRRDTGPWKSHPRRMLRHKAIIQCARLAFGFAGIYDHDEAERIIEATPVNVDPRPDTSNVDMTLRDQWISKIAGILAQDKDEYDIAQDLRDANAELSQFHELFVTVFDELAKRKIISKANYRKYLDLRRNEVRPS